MTNTGLEVESLSVRFTARRQWIDAVIPKKDETLTAVDDVDLAAPRGEVLGIVGESGSGKTTLARCIAGLLAPSTGAIRFDGRPLVMPRATADRRRIQMVFQDPFSSLNPRLRVGQVLAEILRVHRLVPRGTVRERCVELLDRVGLGAEILDAYPRQLSGGQRQRVSIARALALEPEVIVADEPVSALDVSVQATVLNLLLDLRATFGLTLILISHDLGVVRHACDRVAVMYLGRIVEQAETDEIFAQPCHPYTQGLLAALPSVIRKSRPRGTEISGEPPSPFAIPSGCRFRSRCPHAVEICAQVDPPLRSPAQTHHLAACHRLEELAETELLT